MAAAPPGLGVACNARLTEPVDAVLDGRHVRRLVQLGAQALAQPLDLLGQLRRHGGQRRVGLVLLEDLQGLLLGAVMWTTGKEDADTTPNIDKATPDYNKTSA